MHGARVTREREYLTRCAVWRSGEVRGVLRHQHGQRVLRVRPRRSRAFEPEVPGESRNDVVLLRPLLRDVTRALMPQAAAAA